MIMKRIISKVIAFYKVRVDGINIPSQFVHNNRCFENFTDAVDYIEDGWNEYAKNRIYLSFGRKVISEYIKSDIFGYKHQITIVDNKGFVQVVMLAVDNITLPLCRYGK